MTRTRKTPYPTNAASARHSVGRLVRVVPTSHPERERFFRRKRKCIICGETKSTFAYDPTRGAICSPSCLIDYRANNEITNSDPKKP